MSPKLYEFYHPVKLISGENALENLPFELTRLGIKRPLLVTEENLLQLKLIEPVFRILEDAQIELAGTFSRVPPDSSHEIVNEAARLYEENSCDGLLAIGGGSVIDTAKGINIVVTEGTENLLAFMGSEIINRKMKPLIVVPTTAGTGSEATLVAVVANQEKQVKMTFNSYELVPDVAILDPLMTQTLPPKMTAATGMDALSHAIEAYTCLQKNPVSDAFAWSAIELIRENLLKAVRNGKNREARLGMANASFLAGVAFSNSMVGIVHAIGHALGAVAHIPHGVAMGILLPWGMEYNLKKAGKDYAHLLLALAGAEEYVKTSSEDRAVRSIQVIQELQRTLAELTRFPVNLKEAGVKREQLSQVARQALDDGAMTYNPEDADFQDILNILEKAYD